MDKHFNTRYERVSRNLPANVTIKKARKIGPRRGHKWKQQGAGTLSSVYKLGAKIFNPSHIRKGFAIGSRAANSALGKKSSKKELNKHMRYITLV